jgi:hypothetical protein
MAFVKHQPAPLFQAPLGKATVDILGANGLRLRGLNSFHLDEGPDFAWLNIYRTLADGSQLEITRERQPDRIELHNDSVHVVWPACDAVQGELQATYRIDTAATAIDTTFSFTAQAAYNHFELFIANYFTPYYTPRFAVQDNSTHPEGVFWYKKAWHGTGENESWARNAQAEAVFADGRWLSGYPLNWRRGPHYYYPLSVQEHRYGHAIVLMAKPQECFGISGYNAYHNAHYFHLLGQDVEPEEKVSATVRMLLLTEWEDLEKEALTHYEEWLGADKAVID